MIEKIQLKNFGVKVNMINKFLKNFVTMVFVLFVLMSCLSESKSKNSSEIFEEQSVINLWTSNLKPRLDKYMKYVIEKFKKANPMIKINWTDFSTEEMVLNLYSSWQENNLPDIVSFDAKTLMNDINDELIVDLYKFDDEFLNTFFEGILKSSEKNNRLLGVPWFTDIKVLFINKSIMDMSNIDEENYPKNEDEFLNLMNVVKNNSGKFGSVIEPESIKNLIFNGLNVFGENGQVYIQTPQIIEHFKSHKSKFENMVVPNQFLNFDDKIFLYANNEVAMIKSNFQFINSIEKISKEVYDNTVIFPIPVGENDLRYTNTVYLSVVDNGKNEELAMNFIKFILNDQNQLELSNTTNVLPVVKETFKNEISNDENSKINKAKKVAFDSLNKGRDFIYNIEHYNQISNIVEKYSRSIYLDGLEVESVLGNAQQEINKFYN